LVEDIGSVWRYDEQAVEADHTEGDGVRYASNITNTGVWFKVQAATQTHNNLIGLNDGDMKHLTATEYGKLQNLNIALTGEATGNGTFDADGNVSISVDVQHSLGDSTDVVLSGSADGEVLQYDGTQWVNSGTIDAGTWE